MQGASVSSGGAHHVRLMLRSDVICAACPHNLNDVCDHEERVRRIDLSVLRACGLSEDTVTDFNEFTRLIEMRIFAPGLREEICGDCQWGHICGAPFGSAF